MLILLITALSMIGQGQSKEDALKEYLETTQIAATEEFNKMQLPDYFIPIFKVSNRFQGSSIILKDQKNINVPVSTTMFDVQISRYSKSFLLLRLFVETPMSYSSLDSQNSNPSIKSLNNTSIGVGIGLGWYYYDSRTALKPTGVTVSSTLLGSWSIGVANSTTPDFEKENNGMFEINFRVEHFIKQNFAILYGLDLGTVFLTHNNAASNTKYVTTGVMYGAVFGFSF